MMRHSHDATHDFPFLKDFSVRDRRVAEISLSRQEERQRQNSESRSRKSDTLVEDARRQRRNLLGAGKFAELREAITSERLAFRDLFEPPEGLDRDFAKDKSASKRRIDALLRRLGAKPERVRKIGLEFRDRAEKVLSADDGKVVRGFNLPKNLAKWKSLSPFHGFALPWGDLPPLEDPSNPHRWFLFRPPFFGFLFSLNFFASPREKFRFDRELFLSPPAGLVGNDLTSRCIDPAEFNLSGVTAEAQIAFGFVPPTAGLVEVLVDAQSTVSTHELHIDDEFGESHATCDQENFLMMNVLHPNVPKPSVALMSNLHKFTDGDDVHFFREENLSRGQHFFARMFSSGPVPAGQSVVITAGTRSFHRDEPNDMAIRSHSNFQWFIHSVEVRIAP
jgi:hypothetical protein